MLSTRETVDTKAHRLVAENRITWAHGLAVVQGDHQVYVVRRQGDTWSCTCPWSTERPDAKPCSHVIAAALTAPQAPPAQPAPVPAPAPRPRFPRRSAAVPHANFVRVDQPHELDALRRFAANVRFVSQNGLDFAVCEQAVLDTALTLAGRGCAR